MKKIITLIAAVIMLSSTVVNAEAGNTGPSTALGAISGAAIGQAIGRNTEATLIGIAVGGVAGYMIGNEMDKNGYGRPARARYNQPPYHDPEQVIVIVKPDAGRQYQPPGRRCRNRQRRHQPGWCQCCRCETRCFQPGCNQSRGRVSYIRVNSYPVNCRRCL